MSACTETTSFVIVWMELAVSVAIARTRSATTPNILPCSPASDAMIDAFRPSKRVASMTRSMTLATSPIASERPASASTAAPTAAKLLWISSLARMVSSTATRPASAATRASRASARL
jgi:hypothetical protein